MSFEFFWTWELGKSLKRLNREVQKLPRVLGQLRQRCTAVSVYLLLHHSGSTRYMYVHTQKYRPKLRNTEYKSTRIAQWNLKPNRLCKCRPNRFLLPDFICSLCLVGRRRFERQCEQTVWWQHVPPPMKWRIDYISAQWVVHADYW